MEEMDDKKYLTPEGYKKLKIQLDAAMENRKVIAEKIQVAKAKGDLSENAEYADARDEQGFNEGKILELSYTIKRALVVKNKNDGSVDIGSHIKVENNNGDKKEYSIVGSNEADPLNGLISNESPIGSAFMGHRKGDKVTIVTPKREIEYTILEIK